ncbi:UNVERIFIED_CONTAM: hypothetical protein FKN15_040340 [Acipenser sinensis]
MNSLLEESDGNASCSFLMSGGSSPDSLNKGYLFDSSGNSSFDDADYVIPETPSHLGIDLLGLLFKLLQYQIDRCSIY